MTKKGNKKKSGKKAEQKLIDDAFREKLANILAQTAQDKATDTKDSPLGAAYRRGPVLMRGPMIPQDNTTGNLIASSHDTHGFMLILGALCAFRQNLLTALVL